jgi:hypothetical protein
MTSNELRKHFVEWRAPLRGATISVVTWDSAPDGPVFSNLAINGTKAVVDITAPSLSSKRRYAIRCKMTDSGGHIHETEPPIELTVQPGGSF